MLEALLSTTHPRWHRTLEVAIPGPVRGFIDAVLTAAGSATQPATIVAVEAQSQLRRLEEQLRWAEAKAHAIDPNASRLLVVRSTRAMRRTVLLHPALFEAAFPAPIDQALAALRRADRPWPGPALLWASIGSDNRARILDRPLRGIRLGR